MLISGAIEHHFIRILAFREWPRSPLPTGANVVSNVVPYILFPDLSSREIFWNILWVQKKGRNQINPMEFYWTNGVQFNRTEGQIRKSIRDVIELDLENAPYEHVLESMKPAIANLVKDQMGWLPQGVFRARKNIMGKSFENTSKLMAPPKDLVTKFGRLNGPGESVFYCSELRDIALLEVRPEPGDTITCIYLTPIEEAKEFVIIDLAIYETDCAKRMGYKKYLQVKRNLTRWIGKENVAKHNLIIEYIVKDITKIVPTDMEWQYKTTCAIADLLWKDGLMFDGIMYPSVARELDGSNVALFPHLVKDKMQVRAAHEIKIESVYKGVPEFKVLRYAEYFLSDGTIGWKSVNQ